MRTVQWSWQPEPCSSLAPGHNQPAAPGRHRSRRPSASRSRRWVTFCAATVAPKSRKLPPGNLSSEIDLQGVSHQERVREFGAVYKTRMQGQDTVVVDDPVQVQALLVTNYGVFENDWGPGVSQLLGQGAIANQEGEAHRRSRRVLTKVFTKEATLSYIPDVSRLAASFLSTWSGHEDTELLGELKNFTFDISCSLIMGFDLQEQERRQLRRDFTTLTSGFFAHPFDQSNPIAAAAMAARSRLLERIEPRISSEPDDQGNASDHAGGSVTQHTPIQRLYTASQAEGEALSLGELLDQSINLMMASTETTAYSICNMMLELERAPEIVQRLAKEQEALMQQHGPEITGQVIDGMVYGEAFTREVLRVHSPVPSVFRRPLIDLDVAGFTVPKGWMLQLMLKQQKLGEHMSPNQPGFHPERWLDERGHLIEQPPSFMPFGGGPRLCLGWMLAKVEIKVVTALFVRGYTCQQPCPQSPLSPNDLTTADDSILMTFARQT